MTSAVPRRARLTLGALTLTAALAGGAAGPAAAAINNPPVMPAEVVAFPERDFAVVDGWFANQPYQMDVIRNGVVVGTARGETDAAGFAEVNHPGGVCWSGWTPDIVPGDTVRVAKLTGPAGGEVLELDLGGQPIGEATTVANVQAEAAQIVGSTLVVHGDAADVAGNRLSAAAFANLEQRMINPDLVGTEVGRRDVRAPGGGTGYTSSLAYDGLVGTRWTAVYNGLSADALAAAEAGDTRILSWQDFVGGDRVGITIFEVGEVGGPGFGGCPPGARNAATTPSSINAAAVADPVANVRFGGFAQPNATAVQLVLTDADGGDSITVNGTPSAGTWSIDVPAGAISAAFPSDGQLTATPMFTISGLPVGGNALTVTKDTVAPGGPSGSPVPGTYASAQSVLLASADDTAIIHYTTNGTAPTDTSPVAGGHLPVSSSQTIRAIAIDAAGNRSAESALDYVIEAPAAQVLREQVVVTRADGPGGAEPRQEPSTRLALRTLSARRRLRLAQARRGIAVSVGLAPGTEVLRVRLYRVVRGRRQLVHSALRLAADGSSMRLTLRGATLRPGRYVLEVTPGASRRELGEASTRSLRIVR